MPTIHLETYIQAPIEKVFDISRSIDFHMKTTSKTNEKAIAGKTTGLIGLDETVTWEATHFGIKQHLTSKIIKYEFPTYFVDEMLEGAFKSIYHEHKFTTTSAGTLMIDNFMFESPYGFFGKSL